MTTAKKGGKKEGLFGYQGSNQRIHHQHSQAHPWSGFQEECPSGTQRHPEICHERDVHMDTRFNKAVWAKGIRNVPYHICAWLTRKRNKDKNSPNKLYTLVT
uniref:60S ribosomal protein L31 n=1 Tax=Felis catus TaxID=9685 RepID=A0ABI7XVA5_FELCA